MIGIVASRLVDRYHRPFVMVAMSASGRRPRLGPQHPPLRPARRPGRERRPPGGVRRPPDGRGPAGARRAARRLPRRDRGARARLPHSRGPREGRARGRRRPGRRARPRSGRGAAGAAPLRHGQPRDQRAGPGREGVRRAPDGRRRPPRALQRHVRRPALARGRVRHRARQQRARQRRHAPRPRRQARGERVAGSSRAAPGRALAAPGGGARSMRRKPRGGRAPGGAPRGPPTKREPSPRSRPPSCEPRTDPRPARPGRARPAGRPHDDRRVPAGRVRRRIEAGSGADPRSRCRRDSLARRGRGCSRTVRPTTTCRISSSPNTTRWSRIPRLRSASRMCSRSIRLPRRPRARCWSTAAPGSCTWDGVRPRSSSPVRSSSTGTACGRT